MPTYPLPTFTAELCARLGTPRICTHAHMHTLRHHGNAILQCDFALRVFIMSRLRPLARFGIDAIRARLSHHHPFCDKHNTASVNIFPLHSAPSRSPPYSLRLRSASSTYTLPVSAIPPVNIPTQITRLGKRTAVGQKKNQSVAGDRQATLPCFRF